MLSGTFREGLGKTEVAVNSPLGPSVPSPRQVALGQQGVWGTHVRAGQQLLHDVGVEDLPATGQALLLRLQLLIFLDLADETPWVTFGPGALGVPTPGAAQPPPLLRAQRPGLTSS